MKHFVTLVAALHLAAPFLLHAQEFLASGLSADTNRRAGIYLPGPNNAADALALNPAGLAGLTGPVMNLSMTGIFARGTFSNASNMNSPMASNHGFVPFGGFGSSLGRHWSFGIGVLPDMLSASRWNYADTPGLAGTTYGQQAERSEIIAIRGAGGLAYRFSDKLSAGVSVGVDYNSNTLNAPYIFQSHPVLAGLKTVLDLHTTGYGWNTSFGVIANPIKRLSLAASFRTPTDITSHGAASGNIGAEFQNLGLSLRPDFKYSAQVHVTLPPSAALAAGWQLNPVVRLSVQSDWLGWRGSFNSLPVTLTNGNNGDINNLLQSISIRDAVPLDWKNQVTLHGAVERSIGENVVIGTGFLHGNTPVPNSTLSPLTAAIMENGLTTGLGWRAGRLHFGLSYQYDFTASQQVNRSGLLYDEFRGSKTRIGTQAFTLTTGFTL